MTSHWRATVLCCGDPFGLGSTNGKIIARDAILRIHKEREILGAHVGLAEWHDNVLAQGVANAVFKRRASAPSLTVTGVLSLILTMGNLSAGKPLAAPIPFAMRSIEAIN